MLEDEPLGPFATIARAAGEELAIVQTRATVKPERASTASGERRRDGMGETCIARTRQLFFE